MSYLGHLLRSEVYFFFGAASGATSTLATTIGLPVAEKAPGVIRGSLGLPPGPAHAGGPAAPELKHPGFPALYVSSYFLVVSVNQAASEREASHVSACHVESVLHIARPPGK